MRRSFCKTGPIWVALLLLAAPAIADYRQKAKTQSAYIQDHVWGQQARMYRDSDPQKPDGPPDTTIKTPRWGRA